MLKEPDCGRVNECKGEKGGGDKEEVEERETFLCKEEEKEKEGEEEGEGTGPTEGEAAGDNGANEAPVTFSPRAMRRIEERSTSKPVAC